jgi:hypothetical protein
MLSIGSGPSASRVRRASSTMVSRDWFIGSILNAL